MPFVTARSRGSYSPACRRVSLRRGTTPRWSCSSAITRAISAITLTPWRAPLCLTPPARKLRRGAPASAPQAAPAQSSLGAHLETLAEVAGRYRFTERTLHKIVRKFGIPVFRCGTDIRFDAAAIEALVNALRRQKAAD